MALAPPRPRLLVVTHLLLPDTCGGAAVFTDLCRALVERGYDVTVRSAYPYYPEWTDKSGRNGLRIDRYEDDGMHVERFGLYIPRNPRSLWQRLVYEGSYFLSLCRSLVKDERFDAVMVFCPLAGSVAYAGLHKLIYGRPLLLNVQDLPADAAEAGGIASGRWAKRLLTGVQKVLLNRADAWRTISPVRAERLEQLRGRDQPIVLIPDWLHPSVAADIRSLPSKVGRPAASPVRLLYSGNIGAKQGLLDFCKALQPSPAPFEFRIHGAGGAAGEVRDWVAAVGAPRFSFGPLVDESDFARSMHEADLFVITEKPGSGASFFPSKSIPAMAAGTPILAVSSRDSPLGREMEAHGLGPWFSWPQCQEVGAMLASLADSPGRLTTWQENALARARFFERERCVGLFEEVLADLACEASTRFRRARVRPAAAPAGSAR